MAKADYTELDNRAVKLIASRKTGFLQNDLWKELGINSRDCTRLILRLLDAGLVNRSEDRNGRSRTYRITAVAAPAAQAKKAKKENAKSQGFNPMLLMAGESIVPCVACTEECNVAECPMLEEWVYDLAFSEIQ